MATFIPLHAVPLQLQDPVTSVNMSGGTLEFYEAGTDTTTELYADNTGTSIGVSIGLNSGGWPESGGNVIFLFRDQSKALKIVGKNAVGSTLFTADNIPAVASFDSTASAKLDTVEEGADVTDATNVAAAGALMLTGGTTTGNVTIGNSTYLIMGTGAFLVKDVTAGIVASITQTQAGGTPLTSRVNEVATVTSENDAVTMTPAVAGISQTIINNGANTMGIFPASGDDNGSGVDTVTTLTSGSSVTFCAYDTTNWAEV